MLIAFGIGIGGLFAPKNLYSDDPLFKCNYLNKWGLRLTKVKTEAGTNSFNCKIYYDIRQESTYPGGPTKRIVKSVGITNTGFWIEVR